jgi:predicted membrane GTPase involved in stress response
MEKVNVGNRVGYLFNFIFAAARQPLYVPYGAVSFERVYKPAHRADGYAVVQQFPGRVLAINLCRPQFPVVFYRVDAPVITREIRVNGSGSANRSGLYLLASAIRQRRQRHSGDERKDKYD